MRVAQVMYGASVVSGHFGDVVLWKLSPPAAGEVLIRAGGLSSHRIASPKCPLTAETR